MCLGVGYTSMVPAVQTRENCLMEDNFIQFDGEFFLTRWRFFSHLMENRFCLLGQVPVPLPVSTLNLNNLELQEFAKNKLWICGLACQTKRPEGRPAGG